MNCSALKAVVSVLCVGLASTLQAQSEHAQPSTDGLRCSTFKWSADANSPKAAIRVPISLNGHQYWYQLDTGADVVIAYGDGDHSEWIGNVHEPENTGKFAVATFEHDTARPVEGYAAPQLHTHSVIFNVTERENGQTRSLQPRELYASQHYATAIARVTGRL